MKAFQRGFSLIELMTIVAIVSILAVVALPLYQGYSARAQVAEGVTIAGAVRVSISDYHQTHGEWPNANVYNDVSGGRYTASATHDGVGVITVTLKDEAPVSASVRGFSFTLTPTVDDASNKITDWTCETSGEERFLSSGCR